MSVEPNGPRCDPTAETLACRVTPTGRSAIAVIIVRGPAALATLAQCFRPLRSDVTFQPGCVALGYWVGREPQSSPANAPRANAEKLIVGIAEQDVVEIHCHGGRAATTAVLADLTRCHIRIVEQEEWRSATHSRLQCACEDVLLDCRTERTAAIALDQTRGTLEGALRTLAAAIERREREAAIEMVDRLLRYAPLGRRLTEPWKVAIAGQPNVGKSSLLNALVGYQRAITADVPGTTRDTVTAELVIDGWPVLLVDMAGLRETEDVVERLGVTAARGAIERADVLLSLACVDLPPVPGIRAACTLQVWTKSDLAPPSPGEWDAVVSVGEEESIERLIRQIGTVLVPEPPETGAPVPLSGSLIDCLHHLRTELDAPLEPRQASRMRRSLDDWLTP